MAQTVFVGMSGGVDSSVTAALLKEQGYKVTGVYMKNWSQDLPGFMCPWQADFQDAKRVAVQLGIDFKMYDFETQYKQRVVDYMIDEYKAGRTPNPDIMCNAEVKFKLFLNTALEDGAELIATGHYARLKPLVASPVPAKGGTPRSSRRSAVSEPTVLAHRTNLYGSFRASAHPSGSSEPEASGKPIGLFTASNPSKDQSYFLYRVTEEALSKSLFPIGGFVSKDDVRALAKKMGLATADKKDSQGICFVGKVGIKDFLQQYVETEPGPIVDQAGNVIGEHDGAIFYTIGQRHGLNVGGGLPYYVIGKNMAKNEIIVTTDLGSSDLWSKELRLTDVHWINQEPKQETGNMKYEIRTRYRAPLASCTLKRKDKTLYVKLVEEVRAITPGQSAVFYDGEHVLGGGVVI